MTEKVLIVEDDANLLETILIDHQRLCTTSYFLENSHGSHKTFLYRIADLAGTNTVASFIYWNFSCGSTITRRDLTDPWIIYPHWSIW